MIDITRELLYPLGFLSTAAFSLRMLVQWLGSESKGVSLVTPLFWQLSLLGNILLATHGFIQMQFHVFLIQVCNGFISWRNLNLMQPVDKQISTKKSLLLLLGLACLAILAFAGQAGVQDRFQWFRIPFDHEIDSPLHLAWHLFGFLGLALFSSRFWIQWWCAEKRQKSYLGPSFWWISLVGELITLLYFLKIKDPVNYIGPVFAMIPYIRNLILLKKHVRQTA